VSEDILGHLFYKTTQQLLNKLNLLSNTIAVISLASTIENAAIIVIIILLSISMLSRHFVILI
jgi:hypothetical protein